MLNAQTPPDTLWTRTYGGNGEDHGESVLQSFDGNYIICGGTSSYGAGATDIYLIKTNEIGDTLWTKAYGGNNNDDGYSLQQTTDGGFIITGATESYGTGATDVYLIKTDLNGNSLWTKTYGGSDSDLGRSVQQTNDDGYIIVGDTYSSGAGLGDVYLIKTDANGDTLWTQTFGGDSADGGLSVKQTSSGGYIISGWTQSFGVGGTDVYIIKTDANGDSLWTRTFGGSTGEWGESVLETEDNGYIVAGWTNSFGAGQADAYLIKIDVNGDSLWTKFLGGPNTEICTSISHTFDGGYILTGNTNDNDVGDVYLLKTDMYGNELWSKIIGGSLADNGKSVVQTFDGEYIIAGTTQSFGAGLYDCWLLKIKKPDHLINIPYEYPTIQEGINAAANGDTVLVQPGTYVENINYNGKNITVASLFLTTQDTSYISQTIIDGNQNGSVVTFDSGEDSTSVLCGFTITNGNSAGNGGGIYCTLLSAPQIINLIIKNNDSSVYGGGICCDDGSNAIIEDCVIKQNNSSHGGGIFCEINADIIVKNSTIYNNSAIYGGGFYCTEANPVLSNVLIYNNYASYYGGGIVFHGTITQLSNLTVYGNSAESFGGGIYTTAGSGVLFLDILNSVFHNNSPEQINESSGTLLVTYSDIQNGWPGIGNIDNDPLFADSLNSDFNLSENSPCIDAGDPDPQYDDPDGTRNDMGAFYFQQPIADFSASPTSGHIPLTVNFSDQSQPGQEPIISWEWDFDNDGTIDSNDQNPTWVYTTPGIYSVSLTVSDGNNTDAEIKEDLITVVDSPTIIEIPFDYLTIQEGINAAVEGDTVLVQPGTYFENINYNGKNITIGSLFLVIQDTSYIETTIIDGNNNGTVVTFNNAESDLAQLIGFTITNGNNSGIRCWTNCNPTLSNLKIIGNSSPIGGGMWLVGASPTVSDCIISGNNSTSGGSSGGGGVFCGDYSNPVFDFVEISFNSSAAQGGGFYCSHWSQPVLNNVLIISNTAGTVGGGITCQAESVLNIRNATICNNIANQQGGALAKFNSNINMNSSIIWYNIPYTFYENAGGSGGIGASYSNIEGGYGGSMNIDPLFVNYTNGDYYLTEDSPCIDTGDPNPIFNDPDGTRNDMGAFYFYQFDADFTATPLYGFTPLEVNFSDLSIGIPNSWEWDFENDGNIDSYEQNPSWTYNDPGNYTVSLTISDGNNSNTELKQSCVSVFPQNMVVPDTLWTRTYGGASDEAPYSMEMTTDGGYVIAGYTRSFGAGNRDVWVVKTDSFGYVEWSNTFGGINDDVAYSIKQTSDGGYIIAGSTNSFGYGSIDAYLLKINSNGYESWSQSFGSVEDDIAKSVIATIDGGYIIAGYSDPDGSGLTDCLLVKADSLGNEIWNYTYGGAFLEKAQVICEAIDGGYIIAAHRYNNSGESDDIYVFKINNEGYEVWQETYYLFGDQNISDIIITNDNCYLISGVSYTQGANTYDGLLIKINADGNEIWFQYYGNDSGDDMIYSIQNSHDNGYYFAGETESFGAGNNDFWLSKTDSQGNLLWNQTFGGALNESGHTIRNAPDGGCLITGYTESIGNGSYDFWLIKMEPELSAEYFAEPISGHIPLLVSFYDESIQGVGPITSWEWDFNNDGTIDSNNQNPTYVYSIPGTYSVSLTVSDGINSDSEIKTDLITVVDSPTIIEIPLDYPTIQQGIIAAVEGDTVLVQPGTYVENIDFIGKNITVASLFLTTQDTTYISQTIIDGNQNGSVVTFENGEDSTAVLSGFTITNGNATYGGGIFCNDSSPLLYNLKITNNTGGWGGGLGCLEANMFMENVEVTNNSGNQGGGVYIGINTILVMHNFLISGNYGENHAGGVYSHENSVLDLFSGKIFNNSAYQGGGIYCGGYSDVNLNSVTIFNNQSTDKGGGICSVGSANLNVYKCSITGNYGLLGGGIYGELININNSIISYNSGGYGVYVSSGVQSIEYSNFFSNSTGNLFNCNAGIGCIELDPLFINIVNDDYHLSENSPCIDTGNPDPIYNDPDNSRADMGAYYFYQFNCDFASDVISGQHPLEVNFSDASYGILTDWEWDFDNDGTIDSYEQNPVCVYEVPGVYSVSLTINDADSSDTETKIDYVTVINTDPVVQTPLGSITILEDEPDSLSINLNDHFVDPDGDDLSFTYTGNDSIAVEILSDGRVVFTPNDDWFGEETILFTADDLWDADSPRSRSESNIFSDKVSLSESKSSRISEENSQTELSSSKISEAKMDNRSIVLDSLVVTVESVNDAPWFSSVPDTLVMEDDVYQYTAIAEDIENDMLTYAAPVLPSWLTFTPAIGLLVGIPTNEHVGDHPVTITVTDGLIPTPIEQSFVIHVQNFNNPPEITFPASFSFPEDGSATFDFTSYVTDVDNTYDQLTLTWEGNTNIDIVDDNWDITFSSNVPEWSGDEVITFTVDDGVTRTRRSTAPVVSLTDANSKKTRHPRSAEKDGIRDIVSESITVYCTSVNDLPVLTGWQPQELEFSVYQDSSVTFMVSAYDVDSDLNYNWFLNEVLLADELDSIFVHTFTDVGDFDIESVISDEDNEVGQEWLVHVNQVNADDTIVPLATTLYQNYPNPFNPSTTISFDIKEGESGRLTIFNLRGQIIVSEEFVAGQYSYSWDGENSSTGLYFYQLRTDSNVIIKKMIMLK